MPNTYVTGRASKFASGGVDVFDIKRTTDNYDNPRYLPGELAKAGTGKNDSATNADIWNAVADGVVAVQRKLCRTENSDAAGLAVAVSTVLYPGTSSVLGHSYIVDQCADRVLHYDDEGTLASVFQIPDGKISDVAVDGTTGDIFVANGDNNTIDVFTAAGSLVTRYRPSWSWFRPTSVAYDATLKHLYAIDGNNYLRVIDITTWSVIEHNAMGNDARRVTIGGDGEIYVLKNNGSIWKATGAAKTAGTEICAAQKSTSNLDIAVDSSGNVHILRGGKIIKAAAAGTVTSTLDSAGTVWELSGPSYSLALGADDDYFVADRGLAFEIASDGSVMGEVAGDTFAPQDSQGTCLVSRLAAKFKQNAAPYYGGPEADVWRRVVESNTATVVVGSDKKSVDVLISFDTPSGEIVWPQDIKVSTNCRNASIYFAGGGTGYKTTLTDGSTRVTYTFRLIPSSPFVTYLTPGTFYCRAVGYTTRI
jgi:hypothetical protein